MAWASLSSRLASLPLVLAGPIVRKAERSNVSVWFVLKENKNVTLNVYDNNSGGTPIMSGNRPQGVAIGDHVFVYCVTASGSNLNTGTNYYYDINFGSDSLSSLMGSTLTFDGSNRPSFALPPDNLDQVRLVHGSCRKPHGEGYDAMEGVHDMIQSAVSGSNVDPTARPHMLFLTGDQIYADDVADVMLFMINDAASALFNWNESVYDNYSWNKDGNQVSPDLNPGKRNEHAFMREQIGFTGMLPHKPQYSKSHLLKFREYAMMYLFVWSDVLWPGDNDWPDYNTIHPNAYRPMEIRQDGMIVDVVNVPIYEYFAGELRFVQWFKSSLAKVRKALANIPTYMIMDDHEITDDWNLNWHWCKEVYSKPLGRRTVQNGLLAFALFQAWGNTPEQFTQPTKSFLLDAANLWRGAEDSNFSVIKSLLNIHNIGASDPISDYPHTSGAVIYDWHYNLQLNRFAIYVQDSRTWRGYPPGSSDLAFAKLITQEGYSRQLPSTLPDKEIIIVVAPCPVIGVPFIEDHQHDQSTWEDRCDLDTEAWSLDQDGFERLFSNLASRLPVVSNQRNGRFAFLSGDVHYGLSARYQLWGNHFLNDPHPGVDTHAVFAQLTASAFKNQTSGFTGVLALFRNGTLTLHNSGYPVSVGQAAIVHRRLPDPSLNFAWIITSTSVVGKFRPGTPTGLWDYGPVSSGLLVRTHDRLMQDHVEILTLVPDWRYRMDWILGNNTGHSARTTITPHQITVSPSMSNRSAALQDYLAMAHDHGGNYVNQWGNGKEIVGVNNLGEIRFNFAGPDKRISHALWWRMEPNAGGAPLQLFPLTTFNIPVNQSGDTTYNGDSISIPTFSGL